MNNLRDLIYSFTSGCGGVVYILRPPAAACLTRNSSYSVNEYCYMMMHHTYCILYIERHDGRPAVYICGIFSTYIYVHREWVMCIIYCANDLQHYIIVIAGVKCRIAVYVVMSCTYYIPTYTYI